MASYRIRRIKGDIVEVICRNHFSEMGFSVENAGVENFAAKFAGIPGKKRGNFDDTNVEKIQNYIGQLPDLLVGHDSYDYYFVEAKFRSGADINQLSKEFLWNYRRLIFGRDFDVEIFDEITPKQWGIVKEAFNLDEDEKPVLDAFFKCVTNKKIEAEKIRMPIFFYILTKNKEDFNLHLVYFDESKGNFQIHTAGDDISDKGVDVRMLDFIESFDNSYNEVVIPILNDMFSAGIAPKNMIAARSLVAVEADSMLGICLSVARKIKGGTRHGVYFKDLLKQDEIISGLKSRGVPTTKEALKTELEKFGLSKERKMFEFNGEEISIRIIVYTSDFDFYFK